MAIMMLYEVNLRMLQEWVNHSARSTFTQLDKSLDPSIFFVAIFPNLLAEDPVYSSESLEENVRLFGSEESHLIAEAFAYFRDELMEIEPVIAHREEPPLALPINWQEHPSHKGSAVSYALSKSLNQTGKGTSRIYFSDKAVWRKEDRHFVCPVLSFSRKHYEEHYALKRKTTLNESSTSLLNLAINQFLQACIEALTEENADVGRFVRASRNILEDSARAIMLLWNLGKVVNLNTANLRMFDDCNAIAALPYEKRESQGRLLIAEQNHPNIQVKVRFTQPIPINSHRLSRKILEMAQEGSFLLCNSTHLYGLGEIRGLYDSAREDLFEIEFIGQNLWRLSHWSNEMMVVDLGRPKLPAKKISPEEFKTKFGQQFGDVGKAEVINGLIEAATKQTHGALIIISDRAISEARRFAGQCVQVEPFQPKNNDIVQLTAIDGAVLIDHQGQCHALGVILDGEAAGDGEPSRGSRYNSAFRYVSTMRNKYDHKCIAAVISSDGMVNLL